MRASPMQRLLPLLAMLLAAMSLAPGTTPPVLYAEGVRARADGFPENIPLGSPPSAAGPLWAGPVPGTGTRWEPMARRAMADVDVLLRPTVPDGDGAARETAVLAGWHRSWRYVWPRDASFAVAALSAAGRHDDALAVLRFLQRVQEDDGTWQARYRADGSVPDERGTQLDSTGWVLWATWFWVESARMRGVADAEVRSGLEELRPMLVSAASAAAASVDPATSLPVPSPDFWEVPLGETSLGTAAPVLAGLRVSGPLLSELGEGGAAEWVSAAERVLTDGVTAQFGRRGYPRLVTTRRYDASVTFLMPPFTTAPPGQPDAWADARAALRTPAGGHRPGEEFKNPEVSWTPPTALFALTAAASGNRAIAAEQLDWLDAHRTVVGSLPEKVDAEGRPIAVAPLTWTACLVLLTLSALEGDLPTPAPVP